MQRLKALQRLATRAKHPSSFPGKNGVSLQESYRCFAAQPDAASSADEDLIEVIVNGRPVSVPKGSNVLQACEAGGVDIPRYENLIKLMCWFHDVLLLEFPGPLELLVLMMLILLLQVLLSPAIVYRWKLSNVSG